MHGNLPVPEASAVYSAYQPVPIGVLTVLGEREGTGEVFEVVGSRRLKSAWWLLVSNMASQTRHVTFPAVSVSR